MSQHAVHQKCVPHSQARAEPVGAVRKLQATPDGWLEADDLGANIAEK
jgi:hypothetical protein